MVDVPPSQSPIVQFPTGAYTFSGLRGKRPLRYRRGSERTLISQELPSPAQRAPRKQAGAFPKRCKHPWHTSMWLPSGARCTMRTVAVPSAILEIRDVSCALGGRPVLRHIDLNVEEGETVVLLGRSGSGKTTLLKTVNGLVPASAGEVRFEGRAAAQWDPFQMRRRMGYVIQDAGL